MRLFERSGLEGSRLITAVANNFGNSLLHRLDLFLKARRIEQRKVDFLAERVHIHLEPPYALHIERQEQVIVSLSSRGVIGIVLVVIYPKLAECACILDLERQNIVRKRR